MRAAWACAALCLGLAATASADGPAAPARSAGVWAWQVGQGAGREAWKPAAAGSATTQPAEGLAVENKLLTVLARPGAPAAVLVTRPSAGPPTEVALTLTGAPGAPAAIEAVELADLQAGEAALRVSAGGRSADLIVRRGQPFVTVQSAKAGAFLDVRAKARYALLPGFAEDDAVYDPTQFGRSIRPPAENFVLSFLDGNRAIVMCAWPGGLAAGKAAGARPALRAPVVQLLTEGRGGDCRLAGTGIEFLDGPIHVAVIEHENLWLDADVGKAAADRPIDLNWRRPFNALWRADLVKKTKDFNRPSRSFTFIGEAKPDCPAWFEGERAFLAAPGGGRKESVYERALVYALDRADDTPRDVFTPVDIMRLTLGQGPCEYVLDLADARAKRAAAGKAGGGDEPAKAGDWMPPDRPEQAELRKVLHGRGYIYLPRGNRLYRVDADGEDLRLLAEFERDERIRWSQVSWSGRDVAVVVALPVKGDRRGQEVRLVRFDGTGKPKTIFRDADTAGWMTALSCAWTPDDAWLVVGHGLRADAVQPATGKTKNVLTIKQGAFTHLSSDRQRGFYFWNPGGSGDTFTVDKDCNAVGGLRGCGMVTWCQPKISPDGTKMARHDHCYEWGGGKRGYISERPDPGDKARRRYYFPTDANMPFRGVHDMPFWSPDGEYIGFLYHPDVELLDRAGLAAPDRVAVIALTPVRGGPMVWLAPGGGAFPTWGPVPQAPDAAE